jgi:hypothetical protein
MIKIRFGIYRPIFLLRDVTVIYFRSGFKHRNVELLCCLGDNTAPNWTKVVRESTGT